MVFSLHNQTYTVKRLTGCKLSRRSEMWDRWYADKIMYYCIDTDKTNFITLQFILTKEEVLCNGDSNS